MKRQQLREASPKGKRSQFSISRYEDIGREPMSPDRGTSRRESRSGKSPSDDHGRSSSSSTKFDSHRNRSSRSSRDAGNDRSTSRGSFRDDAEEFRGTNRSSERSNGYKVLCVSNIYHKAADADVKDALFRQFKKYGDISIKVVHEGAERLAYIYFTSYEEAREARHAKSWMSLFEKSVVVEPVAASDVNRKAKRSASPEYYARGGASSPTHSTTSTSSVSRRSGVGRHPSLDRESEGPPLHPPHRDLHVRKDFLTPDYGPHHFHHPSERGRYDQPKKEKFPNYLHHVPPEEDDKATRTLFIGNLEVTITEQELRHIFERYGLVEDIDVKRPPPGQGNAYAFVKFLNLDMAHRAKVEMSGQYIGKFQCKIGYGKANPTTRLWVGGLGSWTSLSHLEREFDRFGAIRKIDFVKGENHAYILYDSIDAAQAACQEMRGFPLGGPDRRLRVDFADAGPFNYQMPHSPSRTSGSGYRSSQDDHGITDPYITPPHISRNRLPPPPPPPVDDRYYPHPVHGEHWDIAYPYDAFDRGPRRDPWGPEREYGRHWPGNHDVPWRDDVRDHKNAGSDRRKRQHSPLFDRHDNYYSKRHRSRSPERSRDDRDRTPQPSNRAPRSPTHDYSKGRREHSSRERSVNGSNERNQRTATGDERSSKFSHNETENQENDPITDTTSKETSLAATVIRSGCIGGLEVTENVSNLQELAKCFPVTWHGGLVLKNSSFATRMHLCSGDLSLVDNLMKEKTSDAFSLRITQRLRLDKPKLDDVARRITSSGSSGSYCMMLALPGLATSAGQPQGDENNIQQRPLRNLVTYLKQKEAAGVIALSSSNGSATGKDSKDGCGVLYAFPPCEFSLTLLRCIASRIKDDSCKEQDHLTVIVVRGAS